MQIMSKTTNWDNKMSTDRTRKQTQDQGAEIDELTNDRGKHLD